MANSIYTVGICGGSASGKTSFLNDLHAALPDGSCCIVSQDHYYKPIGEQSLDDNGEVNFDLPDSIDRDLFREHVRKLMAFESVSKKEYTFNNSSKEPELVVFDPAPILILEGLFVYFYEEIRELLDLKVYLDAEEDIKLQRRLDRDLDERGYSNETVMYQWTNHVQPAYENYLLPFKMHADVVIHNNVHYNKGLEVLVDHLKKIIQKA